MSLYKFKAGDIYRNRIKTHPKCEFLIHSGVIVYNRLPVITGSLNDSENVGHVPVGHVTLHEMNVDRPSGSIVYPFVTKQGSITSFKTTSTTSFNSDFSYGDEITGSYPLSASISREYWAANATERPPVRALKNTLDYYKRVHPHYAYSSSLDDTNGGWNKGTQELSLISVPSIFYGSSIKKGTIDLKYYITGTLVARAQDIYQNGQLIQTTGSTTGSTVGIALYNEGFLLLTSSVQLKSDSDQGDDNEDLYEGTSDTSVPSWVRFASTGSDSPTPQSASFAMSFKGTSYVPVITMMAHAPKGQLNHSNNQTYIKHGQDEKRTPFSSSNVYLESPELNIKNVVSSSYTEHSASFSKVTYISRIGIYDEQKNLIAIAKVATPVKKTENRDFTFKLKLDF